MHMILSIKLIKYRLLLSSDEQDDDKQNIDANIECEDIVDDTVSVPDGDNDIQQTKDDGTLQEDTK